MWRVPQGEEMRKFVLSIVIALTGIVSTGTDVSAVNNISVQFLNNESQSVTLQIADFDTSLELSVLICEIASQTCDYANRSNTNDRIRYECFNAGGTSPCERFPVSGPISIELFNYSSWIGTLGLSQGAIPSGTYEAKVIIGAGASYPFIEVFSNTLWDIAYTSPPEIRGESYTGETLELQMPTWSLEPDTTTITWLRCKTPVSAFSIRFNQERPYFSGYEFADGAPCAYLNEDGSMTPSLGLQSIRRVTTFSTTGFTKYKLTEADVGYYIAVQIEGLRTIGVGAKVFGIASTSVVERKTAPVNQVAPTSSFKKTKKIKKLTVGAQVSATAGTWKWANTTTYQWFSCSKRQKSATSINAKQCKSIKRATKANYKVKKTDKRRFLVAQVTATNELGSSVIYANSLKKIS